MIKLDGEDHPDNIVVPEKVPQMPSVEELNAMDPDDREFAVE